MPFIFFFGAAQPDGGVSPPLQLHVRATPDHAQLGEPFTLEVMVTHEPGQRYELKTPNELGDFDYLGQERRRVDGASQSTTTISVKLAAFKLGTLESPRLELEVIAPEGTSQVQVPQTKVQIVSSLPADSKDKGEALYDVKPPEEVPIRSWRLLYVLGGLVLAGLVGYAVNRFLSRPKPVAPVTVAPPEPLAVRTKRALDALGAENLPAKGQLQPYYFRLSEIIRSYLGELYGFDALESTTPELLSALHSRRTPGLPMTDLATFAEASDFVRYAKELPSLDACKAHLELAYRIVHSTQAAVVPPRSTSAP